MNFLAVVGQNSADFLRCFLFPLFHHDVADFLQFGHQFSRGLGNGDAIFRQRGRVFSGGLANAFPAFRLGSGPENQSFEQLIGSLGPATNQTITVKMVTN